MLDIFQRVDLLLGGEAISKLYHSHILVIGVGGVGGYASELLCRAGIGELTIVDGDCVDITNINRQIIAMQDTIGERKVEVMARRLKNINPNLRINIVDRFLSTEDVAEILGQSKFTYIVDAIDSIPTKCRLIEEAIGMNIPIISSMGAGCRTKCNNITIDKLCNTHHDGLSRAIRKRFTGSNIPKILDVVYSTEPPKREAVIPHNRPGEKVVVGSISYIPALFGCYIAEYVIEKIISTLYS